MIVDDVSSLNLYLKDGSVFTGEIDADGEVYVEIEEGSKWVLTDDSEITSLTCAAGCIDLNGHTLTVNGVAYEEGSVSQGEAIEVEVSSSGHDEGMPEGAPPEMPNGEKPSGTPPEKPSGEKPSKKSSEESAS